VDIVDKSASTDGAGLIKNFKDVPIPGRELYTVADDNKCHYYVVDH
jgi:hypothetical protein